MSKPVVIRPVFGLWVYAAIVAVALVALVPLAVAGQWDALLRVAPIPVAALGIGFVTLVAPAVVFDQDAVDVRNPLRSVRVPYGRIERADTHRGFTLHTDDGTVQAWAAPPPDRLWSERAERTTELRRDPRIAGRDEGAVRTSAVPGSPSGDAAITLAHLVRAAEARDAAGAAARAGAAAPSGPVERRWNVTNLLVLAASAAGAIVLAVLGAG